MIKHYVTDRTNQQVIQIFHVAFGEAVVNGLPAWMDALMRAGFIGLADNRSLQFGGGTAVEDWTGLTMAEKERVVRAL